MLSFWKVTVFNQNPEFLQLKRTRLKAEVKRLVVLVSVVEWDQEWDNLQRTTKVSTSSPGDY